MTLNIWKDVQLYSLNKWKLKLHWATILPSNWQKFKSLTIYSVHEVMEEKHSHTTPE